MSLAFTANGDKDNPPLIILHGLFGSSRNWATYAKALSATWYVLAIDLPNHGRSPWQSEPLSYAGMAADVAGFLDQHALPSATVLGHSMGGKVAMTLALTQPQRVDAVGVVDIAPVPYNNRDREHDRYIAAMRAVDLSQITRRAEVDMALVSDVPDAAIRGFLLQNLITDEVSGGLCWQLNLAGLADSLPALVGFPAAATGTPYNGPTRFIVGGESAFVRDKYEPEIHRLFPHAGLDRLAGSGHWPHAEVPKAFSAALLAFLAGVRAGLR